jgi:hypothetical protein
MYPTLNMTILTRESTVGPYPLLSFSLIRYVYSAYESYDGIAPPAPLDVVQSEKNEHINMAMQDIAGALVYDPLPDKNFIIDQMRTVGKWIAGRILPDNCFHCCSNGLLPRTISILSDQDDIPWELTVITNKFLSELAVHARFPFVASGRRAPIQYATPPRMLVIIGRSNDLPHVQLEIDELQQVYKTFPNHTIDILRGEGVTPSTIRSCLENGKHGVPYDIVHFIGHGSASGDKLWLELPGLPFLLDDVPRIIRGNPIVFWNSCFSASSASPRRYQPEISSGFGNRLLAGGASHFIGTLLPIPDRTARQLSCKFYEYIFNDLTVGEALFRAKSDVGAQDALVHTYALYGNPHIRINGHG